MKILVIKPLKLQNITDIMNWVNDPEVVKNFQNFNKKLSREAELRYLKNIIKSKNDCIFSIFRQSDGVYVGQIGINQISWQNKLGRLSLVIKREFWGYGYAQEAMRLALKYAFKKLMLHKIWLMPYVSNKKGIYIYKKLGFKTEGLLREEYFWRGKYHDILRMSMLAKEFRN